MIDIFNIIHVCTYLHKVHFTDRQAHIFYLRKLYKSKMMEQKGMTFDHDFYVIVGKQCCTENVYADHQHNIFTQIN